MDGWIKINRRIKRHWLWDNAEQLKWWLDMLLDAAWEDHEVMVEGHAMLLRKGQIATSLTALALRWHKSKPTLIKFMRRLERENMIQRERTARYTALITIVNYDKYQQLSNNDDVQTKIDDVLDDIKAEMDNDNYWCEVMAMRYHTSTDILRRWIDEFFVDQTCRGTAPATLRDAKQHFNNWLLVKQRIEREEKKNEGNKQRNNIQRRGVEAGINEAQDYKTAF